MKRVGTKQWPRRPTPALVLTAAILVLLLLRRESDPDPQRTDSGETVQVSRVIDGDTVDLSDGRRVRLLGIDAPEIDYDGEPSEQGAKEARDWLQQRLEGRTMRLVLGEVTEDAWGRTLAWIYTPEGQLVNEQILAAGQARLVTRFGLPTGLSPALHRAAARAQAEQRGIWK